MKKEFFVSIILATLLLFSIATSQASLLSLDIGFDPISQVVGVGESVDVALVISGLGVGGPDTLGAFDLDIAFDPTILAFNTATFGDPVLGDQLDIFSLGGNFMDAFEIAPGLLDIYEVSLDTPWDLEDFQADAFTLATLTFDTLAVGTSSLDIVDAWLSDANGDPLIADVQSGNISSTPEPATMLLLGSGLAGIFGLGRKRWFKS